MPTVDELLRDAPDFKALRDLAHPRVRKECGPPNVFPDGVRTYTRVTPGTGLHMLLGEFSVKNVTVVDFKESLTFKERVLWDDLFMGGKDVKQFTLKKHPSLDIFHRHMAFRSPIAGLISPRDFEVLISETYQPDGSFICKCRSITHGTKVAPASGTIRGEILTTGFIVSPAGKDIHVLYAAQIDPKGWVPASVVNLIISRQARSILSLKKHVVKRKLARQRAGKGAGKPAHSAASGSDDDDMLDLLDQKAKM